jgi:type III secretory pathway component EscS
LLPRCDDANEGAVLFLAELFAVGLYSIPLGLALAARSRRERALWEYALEIPLVVAVDLLAVMLLARLVRLELSILAMRLVWAALGGAAIVRGRRAGRIAWPAALRRRELGVVGVAVAASVALSAVLSRTCHNADRAWHIPLVSSIRSQRIPFANVYEPGGRLAYHYTGDVLAAMLQVLSVDVLHASRALSLAHDVTFGLTGASAALLLLGLGYRRVVPVTGIVLSMLLSGPLAVLRDEKSRVESGYNFINYLKLSYRPHVCLAGLFIVGFAGAVMVRLRSARRDEAPAVLATALPLLGVTAALVLTDEASVGVLGLALGVAWLFVKESVHPQRLGGLAVFAGLCAALVVPVLLIGGSFDPGGPGHTVTLVPWRSPGYYHRSVPLSSLGGCKVLFFDLAPMLAATLIGIVVVLRRRTRDQAAALAFYVALMVVSVILLTRVDIDQFAVENHRFMTAAMFLFPLFLGYWLAPRAGGTSTSFSPASFAPTAAIVVMGVSSVSSLDWLTSYAPGRCANPGHYGSKYDFFALQCRAQSAGFGERARPTYLAKDVWYYHAGCHPIYSAAPPADHWTTWTGIAQFGTPAFLELDREMVRRDEPLALVCPLGRSATPDPVCNFAKQRDRCRPLGPETTACELSGEERAELLQSLPRAVTDPAKAAPTGGEGTDPPEPHLGSTPH